MFTRQCLTAAMLLSIGLGLAACAPGDQPAGGNSDAAGTASPDKAGPQVRQGGKG